MSTTKTKSNTLSIASIKKSIENIGKYQVSQIGDTLILARIIKGRERKCELTRKENGQFSLKVAYMYESPNSFFDFCEAENRGCRDYSIWKPFFNDLKKAELWHLIDIKKSIKYNENNKRSRLKKAKELYDSLSSH
jgi:hypothetical protein